jgi:transcriptional regulator with XRE-family HTH domain
MEIGADTTVRIVAATLGDRITSRLLETGLSAAKLARFVGVTNEAVSQWESGETQGLKPENLVHTAEFLATTERWLTFGCDARCDLQGRIRDVPYPAGLLSLVQTIASMAPPERAHLQAVADALARSTATWDGVERRR